jgi:hypothetical protein
VLHALRVLIIALLGAGFGLGSAWFALTDDRIDFTPAAGPWRISGAAGGLDPYARARSARGGLIALGPAEGVAFVARQDSGGRRLDPNCHYRIAGPIPASDIWTITVSDEQGHRPVNPANRIGFTSRDVIRNSDGTTEIIVGRTARPGNFVATGDLRSLEFTLRLYSAYVATRLPKAEDLPRIEVAECAGRPQ